MVFETYVENYSLLCRFGRITWAYQ